jgi:hypothetical protein
MFTLRLPVTHLRNGLRVRHSATRELDTLNSVRIVADSRYIEFASTNRYTLATYIVETETDNGNLGFTIPAETAAQWDKLIPARVVGGAMATITVTADTATLSFVDASHTSALVSGEFPTYRNLYPVVGLKRRDYATGTADINFNPAYLALMAKLAPKSTHWSMFLGESPTKPTMFTYDYGNGESDIYAGMYMFLVMPVRVSDPTQTWPNWVTKA